jgi:hypothetical protein
MMPSPVPFIGDMDGFNFDGGAKPEYHTAQQGGLYVIGTGITTNNFGVVTLTKASLPAGSYHWHSTYIMSGGTQPKPVGLTGGIQIPASAVNGISIDYDFTLKTNFNETILLRGTPGVASTIHSQIGIYTQSDWAAMQSLGMTYFDGGTMPLAS